MMQPPATQWPATRSEAAARLATFVLSAGQVYARQRNYDLGPGDRRNVSVLSPYIRHRLITEAEVVEAVLGQHSLRDSEKFIQEVCWRTYWKGWLEQRPQVWHRTVEETNALLAGDHSDPTLARRLLRAETGATGIACFDAWAAELVDTGYLHNHARMWFASIWIYTLKLPWQLGADFFMRHLLDGDAASNTLSWRWVGGLQTQGKTYLARADNIADYTKGRFGRPTGLATDAPPLVDASALERASGIRPAEDGPAGPAVLVLTDDDMLPETWSLGRAEIASVVVLEGCHSDARYSPNVLAFKSAALADAAERAAVHFDVAVQRIDATSKDAAKALADVGNGQPIVTSNMTTGWTRSLVQPLLDGQRRSGRAVHHIRREWDTAFWPHASKGFFQLKEKIPTVLRALGYAA